MNRSFTQLWAVRLEGTVQIQDFGGASFFLSFIRLASHQRGGEYHFNPFNVVVPVCQYQKARGSAARVSSSV